MWEFLTMLPVIVLLFCIATIIVVIIAGSFLKASRTMKKKRPEETD